MGKKKGLSQTPLWVLSEEEMEAAGWPDFDAPKETDAPPKERYSVLEDRPGSLTSVWDPMRDDASKQIEGHAQKSVAGKPGKADLDWPAVPIVEKAAPTPGVAFVKCTLTMAERDFGEGNHR